MGSNVVSNANQQKRYGFWGSTLPNDWAVVSSTGTGMAWSVTGGALVVTTGTVANDARIFRCSRALTVKSIVRFIATISQRIANNTIMFEVTNADNSTFARFIFDGTSNTAAKVESKNHGFTSAAKAIGTTPSSAAAFVSDMMLELEQCFFSIGVADASALKNCSALFDRNIPEMDENYYVQISVVNGAVAPATTTTVTIDAVVIEDLTMVGVEVLRGGGDLNPSTGLPVNVLNALPSHPVTVSGTATVSGPAALDAALSGSPVLQGIRGSAAIPAAMSADGDLTAPWSDRNGRQHTIISAGSALDNSLVNYKLISAATTNGTLVLTGARRVYRIFAHNINAAWRYLKIYNKATAPTVGTDIPIHVLGIPPNNKIEVELTLGIYLSLGLGFALTTGVADADIGAVAANEIVVNLGYA